MHRLVRRLPVMATTLVVGVLLLAGCVGEGRRPVAGGAPSTPAGGGGGVEVSPSPPAPAPSTAGPSPTKPPKPTKTPTKSPTTPPTPTRPAGHPLPPGVMKRTGSDAVALTFDDGPEPTNTPKILDLLARFGVKATFCMVGFRAAAYPDLVRRVVREGHTLCNHSWKHRRDLSVIPIDDMRNDLRWTNEAIRAAVPGAEIRYFRAPAGDFTEPLVQVAAEFGMRSIHWDVDPDDWNRAEFGTGPPMVAHIVAAVQAETRPGSIVLSHDAVKPDTTTAYEQLLPWLKEHFRLISPPTV